MNRAIGRGSLAALLLCLSLAAPAAAVEQEGEGEAIKHVKNIAYPNLHQERTLNSGTDLEFAEITIPQAPAAAAPPSRAATPKPSKRARAKKCKRPSRNASRKARARYRRCKKARARARARKADVNRSLAGVQKRFAFAGTYGDGLNIIDISDPAGAQTVSVWDCGVSQGDVQVFRRDDLGGRWFVAYTHDTGYTMQMDSRCVADLKAIGVDPEAGDGYGTYFADVTDPYHPKTVSYVPVEQGSHNGSVHPSGRYLYNSNSDLITSPLPAVEIVDITDVAKPELIGELSLTTFPGLGTESHDINFSRDGSRAYVAAISHAEILDTTDPAAPQSIAFLADPAVNVYHETDEITIGERKFLVAEDEFAGATGTGQCPNGGVHVYDITGPLESAPLKVGAWNIDDVGLTSDDDGVCTAHVFQLDDERDMMTIAYYNGGVRVVDMSALEGVALGDVGVGMKQLGWFRFPDSNTWAVKVPGAAMDRGGFYMYGNDHNRGFDVYRYEPTGTTTAPGEWLTPEQSLQRANWLRRMGGIEGGRICILPAAR